MKIEIIPVKKEEQSIIANLLELYCYEFTEIWDFDIGDNGFYGYKGLPLYWEDPNRYPFLIYIDKKIGGFVLVQKGSPISDDNEVYDIAEFFVMKKYKRKGIGLNVAHQIWNKFKGPWQVRVLKENKPACAFWYKAIQRFTGTVPVAQETKLNDDVWLVYRFS